MFIGHYSAAFALKTEKSIIPLWALFIAVQFMDIIWGILVLFGIEKIRIDPGISGPGALELTFTPYTHSLGGALAWSVIAVVLYSALQVSRVSRDDAGRLGIAVLSHWFLDFIVHPDLSLYGDPAKVGLGLAQYAYQAFFVEVLLLFVGVLFYLRRNAEVPERRKVAVIAFGLVMILIQAAGSFTGKPFQSGTLLATVNLALYAAFAGVMFLIERERKTNNRTVGFQGITTVDSQG